MVQQQSQIALAHQIQGHNNKLQQFLQPLKVALIQKQ